MPFRKALSRYQLKPFPQKSMIWPSPPGMSWVSSEVNLSRPVNFFAANSMERTFGFASLMVPASAVYDAVKPPMRLEAWEPITMPGTLISFDFIGCTISFSRLTLWILDSYSVGTSKPPSDGTVSDILARTWPG